MLSLSVNSLRHRKLRSQLFAQVQTATRFVAVPLPTKSLRGKSFVGALLLV
jgi:hypothetical protein